jgi:uncharacterized protein
MTFESRETLVTREPDLPPLVATMTRTEFYPEPVASVDFKQTHISYVFLAGEYVYKVKKPVRFSFIDCSELAQRYKFCVDEVRLNSRLSPKVYLGVYPVLRRGESFVLGPRVQEPHADAVEYAVKMTRLPECHMLDRLVVTRLLDSGAIQKVATRISEFHTRVTADHAWTYGRAAELRRSLRSELDENRPFVGVTLAEEQLAEIAEFAQAFIMSHSKQLDRRAASGRVREGHGDLRAEHIYLCEDRVEVIDCVEFSERLRYCDVASEIAFLSMDLERLGAAKLADELVGSYAKKANDEELLQFVPFYKCYRACVRGKVESLRSREVEIETSEREQAFQLARAYFALACKYARLASPAVIVVCGLSGTGKSTLARLLQIRTGFSVINSDVIRKRLAGVAPNQHMRSEYGKGLYSGHFTNITYDALINDAEASIREGRGVILDATFKNLGARRRVLELAERHNAPVLFVECIAAKDEALRRLERRKEIASEVSDATPEILDMQIKEFEPITELSPSNHIRVHTPFDRGQVPNEVESALLNVISLSHSCAENNEA